MTTIITFWNEELENNSVEPLPGTTICTNTRERLAKLIPGYYTNSPEENYAFLEQRFEEKQRAIRDWETR